MNFLYILASLGHFSQGIASLAGQPLYYYLREHLGISVSTIMLIGSLTNIPWMVKPLYAIFSDLVPIRNLRRKPYIFISAVISSVMALVIGLTPVVSLSLLIAFLLLYSIGQAGDNVGTNGLVVEQGVKDGSIGKIQSTQWASLGVATVICGVLGGWISTKFDYHFAYLIIALFPASIAIMSFWLKEEKVSKHTTTELVSKHTNTIKEFFSKLKNKNLIISALFLFLFWFDPSFGTPLMDKMRGTLHFSKIWIGWLDTIGSAFGIVGALLYFKFNKGLDIKKWLYYSVILNGFATFAYLYLTPRTIVVYSVLFSVSGQFTQLLMLSLAAYTCPEGVEATTFALLTAIVNFGAFCSNLAGAKLFGLFGFNGLVIVSGITGFLCLPFIPYLEIKNKT
jgi:predicted MFS family arabinose efflux permease